MIDAETPQAFLGEDLPEATITITVGEARAFAANALLQMNLGVTELMLAFAPRAANLAYASLVAKIEGVIRETSTDGSITAATVARADQAGAALAEAVAVERASWA